MKTKNLFSELVGDFKKIQNEVTQENIINLSNEIKIDINNIKNDIQELNSFSEYEKQAINFLNKYNTKISIKFFEYGKHFQDDTESRNIYKVTIRRNKKSYTFKYGDSIANTKVNKTYLLNYDILACLTKYNPESFENFCNEYGYNTDSRKALKIYNVVQKEYNNIYRLFNDCMNELSEIQ